MFLLRLSCRAAVWRRQVGEGPYPLRKAIDTAATSAPCNLIVDWLSPWVDTSRRAVKPEPAGKISAPLMRPETVPDTPRVVSAQVPESEPPY
jgi:hypothetical protein